jgi:hypothetical protein
MAGLPEPKVMSNLRSRQQVIDDAIERQGTSRGDAVAQQDGPPVLPEPKKGLPKPVPNPGLFKRIKAAVTGSNPYVE